MKHDDLELSPLSEADWEALRRDEPHPRDVELAYRRFTASRFPRLTDWALWRWLFAGLAAGVSVVSAATGYRWTTSLRSVSTLAPSAVPRPAASVPESAPRRAALSRPPASSSVVTPPPTERVITPARAAAARAALPDVPDEATTNDPKWQDVARALRERNYAGAEAALNALEVGRAAADREAATLTLAQVLMANDRAAEARSRLELLSTTARSPLVREKAKHLLAQLRAHEERSTTAPAATQ